jgi:hypothetical protein
MDLLFITSKSVHSCGKYVDDIEQVGGKFLFWREKSLIENHEFATVLLKNLSNEVDLKSCKTVSVGNHKCDVSSRHRSFQNGFKTFSFEVESTADKILDASLLV